MVGKNLTHLSGTIEAEVTTVIGVPPCLRVDTSTRPERKRAEVIAAVPGAAEDRPRELILENATLTRANRHTCGRTTPGRSHTYTERPCLHPVCYTILKTHVFYFV